MKLFDPRSIFALALGLALSACGGGDMNTGAAGLAEAPSASPLVSQGNNPQPDCAADNCTVPRIIDGLAEQFRSAALERQADASPEQLAAGDGQVTPGAGPGLAPDGQ